MTIGQRLQEERLRLRLSQPDFAAKGGVGKNTQLNYEKGDSSPTASFLAEVAKLGVDVLYVVTGERLGEIRHGGQASKLLDYFAAIGESSQGTALAVMEALAHYNAVPTAPEKAQFKLVDRSEQDDAELWRSIARGLPTAPGVDPNSQLRLVDFLAVVEEAYKRELAARAAPKAAEPAKAKRAA